MEAAIGFAQMKVDPDMNLDLSAYAMAKACWSTPPGRPTWTTSGGHRDGTLPVVPWKLTAARWSYALSVWRENVKSLPAGPGTRVRSGKWPALASPC